MAVHFIANRWMNSGYLMRGAAVIYLAPAAIWGVCSIEAILRCVVRAIHTGISLDSKSRSYRWKQTQIHAHVAYGTGLLCLVSLIPFIGTYKSYAAFFKMTGNHISNTLQLRDLKQRINAHADEKVYNELKAFEPDLEKLISDANETAPTKDQIREVKDLLKASLIGRSWIYTGLFHTIDGSYSVLRILAIRVKRLTLALFAGNLLRAIVKVAYAIKDGIKQEVKYTCNLVDQPNRANVSEGPVPDLCFDNVTEIFEILPEVKARERVRLALATDLYYRQLVASNAFIKQWVDDPLNPLPPLPKDAPGDYYHTLKELPAACTHYSKCKASGKAVDLKSMIKYFKPIFSCMEQFKSDCTEKMTGDAKKEILWSLLAELPNLHEITLDLKDIEPRWQMLIVVRLAMHSTHLRKATLINADHRTVDILRRYSSFFCTVTTG